MRLLNQYNTAPTRQTHRRRSRRRRRRRRQRHDRNATATNKAAARATGGATEVQIYNYISPMRARTHRPGGGRTRTVQFEIRIMKIEIYKRIVFDF